MGFLDRRRKGGKLEKNQKEKCREEKIVGRETGGTIGNAAERRESEERIKLQAIVIVDSAKRRSANGDTCRASFKGFADLELL